MSHSNSLSGSATRSWDAAPAPSYRFADLVDIEAVREMMVAFHAATGFVVGIVDADGRILVQVGYRDICTKFHRVHPESERRCIESDLQIARQLERGSYCSYTCANGLIDAASPIHIDGEHLATIFTGQFFFEAPDEQLFLDQAARLGFDRQLYLRALAEVPVVTPTQYEAVMIFLTRFASMLGELGLKAKRERDVQQALLQTQKMEAIGRLAGGVAHDFNNLLQGIIGFADVAGLVLERSPEQARGALEQVLEAANRARSLVGRLLAFSRREELLPVSLRLDDLVKRALPLLRLLLGERVELTLSVQDCPDLICADPGQIEQILMNLCVNSRDALPDGGQVEICVCNLCADERFRLEQPQAAPGDYVVLEVRDNGHGIAPEHLAQIFEPFFTTKERGRGIGLGLATVYAVVERHRGFITVSSEIGQGTAIAVHLPAAKWATAAESRSPSSAGAVCGNETILLAEDDDIVRSLALQVLEAAGYRVLAARNGQEAIALLDEHRAAVDLLVLDVLMPLKNGREVYEHARTVRDGIPVLFCSGYSGELLAENYRLSLTAGKLLLKPYRPNVLLAEIRALLDRRSA